ncbi:MAG: FG-GAP-like repeat-containing protein [Myxococcota bacterium]
MQQLCCPMVDSLPKRLLSKQKSGFGLLLFTLSGCNQPCVGVGCEDAFGSALVSLFPGNIVPTTGTLDADSAVYTLTGTEALGPDWDILVVPNTLIAGSPLDGSVRSYSPEIDGSQTNSDANGRIDGERSGEHFGAHIATLPGADGQIDLLVSAPLFSPDADARHSGAVYRLSDFGNGFTGSHSADEATLRVTGTDPGGRFGAQLAVCTDLDADGEPEWMASADRDDSNASFAGQVVLVQSQGVQSADPRLLIDQISTRWTGTDIGERAGHALLCNQDLTGDGVADIVVGAPFADITEEAEGVIYIMSGADVPASGPLREVAQIQLSESEPNAWFGWSVAAGDIDGDGNIDLAVGAPGVDEGTGVVRVWSGTDLQEETLSRATYTLVGELPGDSFGRAILLQDLDGDGFDDLIIGAPFVNPTDEASAFQSGQVSIFSGSAGFEDWSPQMDALDSNIIYEEAQQYLRTGRHLFAGNFDDDARADLVLLQRTSVD